MTMQIIIFFVRQFFPHEIIHLMCLLEVLFKANNMSIKNDYFHLSKFTVNNDVWTNNLYWHDLNPPPLPWLSG